MRRAPHLTANPQHRCHCSHFIDGETEARNCSRPPKSPAQRGQNQISNVLTEAKVHDSDQRAPQGLSTRHLAQTAFGNCEMLLKST